jgi:hypothetical protein
MKKRRERGNSLSERGHVRARDRGGPRRAPVPARGSPCTPRTRRAPTSGRCGHDPSGPGAGCHGARRADSGLRSGLRERGSHGERSDHEREQVRENERKSGTGQRPSGPRTPAGPGCGAGPRPCPPRARTVTAAAVIPASRVAALPPALTSALGADLPVASPALLDELRASVRQ